MFKITVQEIQAPYDAAKTAEEMVATRVTTEVFSQTVSELNLPQFIRALNPVTRKRKAKAAKE